MVKIDPKVWIEFFLWMCTCHDTLKDMCLSYLHQMLYSFNSVCSDGNTFVQSQVCSVLKPTNHVNNLLSGTMATRFDKNSQNGLKIAKKVMFIYYRPRGNKMSNRVELPANPTPPHPLLASLYWMFRLKIHIWWGYNNLMFYIAN